MKKPFVDKSLLEYLDRLFPNTCPAIDDTDREIWVAVGTRRVVDHLKSLHDAQIKESMK
jgi:hypothetical protein